MRRIHIGADEETQAFARRVVTFMVMRIAYPSLEGAVLIGLLIGYEMGFRRANTRRSIG